MGSRIWCLAVVMTCAACAGKVEHSGGLVDIGPDASGPPATAGAPPASDSPGQTAGAGRANVTPTGERPVSSSGSGGVSAGPGMSAPGTNNPGTPSPGIPLVPVDGWVDGMSNVLGIQGAMFSFADSTTRLNLTEDASQVGKMCIQGIAAQVDLKCTPTPPAVDCFGTTFGAAIGLNLNQVVDATGVGGSPLPYDASKIRAFAFEVDGRIVPDIYSLRFSVESGEQFFCNPSFEMKVVTPGENEFAFEDLRARCWASPGGPSATTVKTMIVKLVWQVVSNDKAQVPFDFCISNVRAIPY